MGLFKGGLTVRRYTVRGDVPDDFRTRYADALLDRAFREPMSLARGVEITGWCEVHSLLDADFSDLNKWLYNHYVVAGMRTDKKVLPANLFKAHLDKRVAAWCVEQGRTKAPTSVRAELKEFLEQEMLLQTLPRVQVVEWVWHLVDGWVALHNTSDSANDRFRKLFRETFGLELAPFSPLDFLVSDPELAGRLETRGTSDYRLPGDGR